LLDDVVNIDQTRQHINYYRSEVQKGGKVAILTRGWVVTNMFVGSVSITNGNEYLYMGGSGLLDTGKVADTVAGSPTQNSVGRLLSKLDQDGYAKVLISLPN
jgi:hypothetical protein